MRTDAGRLGDIPLAIAKIRERATGCIDAFERDEMLQVRVIHHLQVIGEAARGISQDLREQWPQIVALRNILVHEYFGLNLHQVWTMAQKDVPELEKQIQRIRADVASDPPRDG